MQPIVRYLNRAFLDRLWHSLVRERRAPGPPAAVAAPAPRLGTAREWEMVVGVLARDLARVSAVAAIQSRAALKIDAAEHALGRIIADCSKVLTAPLVPARWPARRLAHRPELRIRRQLAA